MSLLITCPLPTAIGSLTDLACALHFGQIVKIAFQRANNAFTDITLEAEWDTKLSAIDDTKISITTFCENLVIPAGEAITEGGDDNSTLFGQSLVVGKGQVTVSGRFRGLDSAGIREFEGFLSEASVNDNLSVYLINEFGKIIAAEITGAAAVTGQGFPIQSFFLSDVGSEGFNTHNFNNFQWSFKGEWSNFFEIYTPGFDILTK